MNPSSPPTDERYLVPGLARGLQLLACFSRQEPRLTGAELSRRLQVPRASVFRMLQTLEQMGYVERTADSAHYQLGIGTLRLGFEYLASMELAEHGRIVIDELRDQTGYAAHVVVRDGREVVVVAKAPGRSTLYSAIQVGARLPAHATVLGRVLLADLSLAELGELYPEPQLTAYTERTPTSLVQLKSLIDADRVNGHGISQGGFETGISTLAAPVFNGERHVVAAISITVPAQSVSEAQVSELLPLVQQAAAKLTTRIHHQARPASPRA